MHKIFFAVMMMLTTLTVSGQTHSDSIRMANEQINRIKLDTENYIYAESTMSDWTEAYNAAKNILKDKLTLWLADEKKNDDKQPYLDASDKHIADIKAMRGNRYRAFVYLKKSNVLSLEVASTPSIQEASTPSTQETVASTDTQPITEPVKVVETESQDVADSKPEIEQEMLTVQSFEAVEPFITKHKDKGDITSYGKYSNHPESGKYYMFVYNRSSEIAAYLICDEGVITNIKTNNTDSMDAYKGCGAIWFK